MAKLSYEQIDKLVDKAKQNGEKYFYGNPCKYGHDGLRYSNRRSACVHCSRETAKSKYIPTRIVSVEEEENLILQAKKEGKNYFHGNPCKQGHTKRYITKNKHCIECARILAKKNPHKRSPEKQKKYWAEYKLKNEDKIKEKNKRYRLKNNEQIKIKSKKYKEKNKELIKIKNKIYNQKNSEKISERARKYNQQDSVKERKNNYIKTRYKEDEFFRLHSLIRQRINSALKRNDVKKDLKSIELVGCTIDQLKSHLESKFTKDMNWENREEWQIDHIVPVKYFMVNYDINDSDVQRVCFSYLNLQPLWKIHNQKKGDRIKNSKAEKLIRGIQKKLNLI